MAVDLYIIMLVGFAISVIIALVAITLRRPLLGTLAASPEAVLRHIAFLLRAVGFPTSEEPGRLKVRVNSLTEVKVHARPGPGGTEVRYEVDASPLGWTLVLIFAGFGYLGAVALVLALHIHFSARSFARDQVGPLLRAPVSPVTAPPSLRAVIIDGLSEAQRLISEAHEFDSEAYQNGIGLIAIASLATWAFVFVVPAFQAGGVFPDSSFSMFAVATAAALSFLIGGVYVLRRRLHPRLEELRRERDLYRSALMLEVSGITPPDEGPHALELLLRAVERSHVWREIRRKRKLWHDPVAQFTIFLFAWGAGATGLLAAFLDILPLTMRTVLALLSAGFLAGFAWSVRSWRRQVREEDERERVAWEARRSDLEERLRMLLGG